MKQIKTIIRFAAIVALLLGLSTPVLAFEQEANSAADLTAIASPSADMRANHLRAYLKSHNSPLADEAETFVTEADAFSLDWKLVAAIAGTESTFGKHVPTGSYNGWGWGIPTGAQSGIAFGSWADGIATVSKGLKTRYIDRGAVTIEQMGAIYAASPRWAGNVRFFMEKIEAFIPTDPSVLEVTI